MELIYTPVSQFQLTTVPPVDEVGVGVFADEGRKKDNL